MRKPKIGEVYWLVQYLTCDESWDSDTVVSDFETCALFSTSG